MRGVPDLAESIKHISCNPDQIVNFSIVFGIFFAFIIFKMAAFKIFKMFY
jgi:hypothetical protein